MTSNLLSWFMRETNAFVDYTDHMLDDYQGVKDIVYAPTYKLAELLGRDRDQTTMAFGFLTAMATGVVISMVKNVVLRKLISFSMAIFIGCQVLGVRFLVSSLYQLVAFLSMLLLPRNVQHHVTITIAVFVTIVVHIYLYQIRDNTFGTASSIMASFVR